MAPCGGLGRRADRRCGKIPEERKGGGGGRQACSPRLRRQRRLQEIHRRSGGQRYLAAGQERRQITLPTACSPPALRRRTRFGRDSKPAGGATHLFRFQLFSCESDWRWGGDKERPS